jgi:hypothetical protein
MFGKKPPPTKPTPFELERRFKDRLDSLIADFIRDVDPRTIAHVLEERSSAARLRWATTAPMF